MFPRTPHRRAALLVLLLAALANRPARADAVKIQFSTKVPAGGTPKIRFVVEEPVEALKVSLTSDAGPPVEATLGPLAPGATREVALPAVPGRHHFQGTLMLTQHGQTRQSPLQLDTVVDAGALGVQIDRAQVDLAARRLEARLSRPPRKVVMKVYGAGGGKPLEAEQDLSSAPADGPVVVTWPDPGDEMARIDLTFYDKDGFYTGVSLLPWRVSIPHEEVTFATDSAAVAPAEAPKLVASLKLISESLRKHGSLGPIKLFVAGHTDTVGAAAYNLKLSQRRAQAIAAWFRKNGLRIPILYEGFGEQAPAVDTRDETDEPRNRRVDYILALEEPGLKAIRFRPAWKAVP